MKLIFSLFDVLLTAYSGNCFGMGSFLAGHGDVLRSNRCILGLGEAKAISASTLRSDPPNVGRFYGECADSHLTMSSNEYFTPDGTVIIGCNGNSFHTMKEMQQMFGLEVDSTGGMVPDDLTILEWASELVCYQSRCF